MEYSGGGQIVGETPAAKLLVAWLQEYSLVPPIICVCYRYILHQMAFRVLVEVLDETHNPYI